MEIVILTGSPHKNGTSNTLVKEFIRGASEKGHNIKRFDTAFLDIHPCIACEHCGVNGNCVFNDDMPKILDAILESDMIVFASPIYYFGYSAQIKSAMDRFYSINSRIKSKHLKSLFIATAGNYDDRVMESLKKQIDLLVYYLNFDNKGMLLAKGYGYPGASTEIAYKKEAYKLGKEV